MGVASPRGGLERRGSWRQDVDHTGEDQPDDEQGDQRLDRHESLDPVGQGHVASVGLNAITFVNATYRWSWNRGCQFACPSPSVRVCGNWKSGKRYLRPDGAVGWVLLAVSVG